MSYDYGAQTALLEGLASDPHPSRYELCADHAATLTVPRGWTIEVAADSPVRPRSHDVIDLTMRRTANLA
jgi:hypothetical protein